MAGDARRSAAARLVLGAAVCVVALGLGWQASRASTGYVTPGMVLPTVSVSWGSGDTWVGSQYYAGYWVEGDPMRTRRGYRSDVRVVLVPAAVALAWVSQRRTDLSLRLARVAVAALAAVGVQALGRGMTAAALAMALVVVLTAPVVAPDWLRRLRLGRLTTRPAAA